MPVETHLNSLRKKKFDVILQALLQPQVRVIANTS